MKKVLIGLVITLSTASLAQNNWLDKIINTDPLLEKINKGEYIWPDRVNVQDTINDPIFKCVLDGDIKHLSNLLKGGANPNRIGLNDHTPLITAARSGKSKIVYELLKYGAAVNHVDKLGWTALHHSLNDKSADFTVVKILIIAGANPNARDHRNRTPLHRAAQYGSSEIVSYLINNGANPSLKDYNNDTPLERMKFWRSDSEALKISEILK